MRNINGDLDPRICTVFLMPPRDIAEVSSSMVKGLIGPSGWRKIVQKYVPAPVYRRRWNFTSERPNPERWSRLWHAATTAAAARGRFDRLVAMYAEPHRHYHNRRHIADCLNEFDQVRQLPPSRRR